MLFNTSLISISSVLTILNFISIIIFMLNCVSERNKQRNKVRQEQEHLCKKYNILEVLVKQQQIGR